MTRGQDWAQKRCVAKAVDWHQRSASLQGQLDNALALQKPRRLLLLCPGLEDAGHPIKDHPNIFGSGERGPDVLGLGRHDAGSLQVTADEGQLEQDGGGYPAASAAA